MNTPPYTLGFARLAALAGLLASAFASCAGDATGAGVTLRVGGRTMGTSYSLIVVAPDGSALEAGELERVADSLLAAINAEVSTYEAGSLISAFNRGDTVEVPVVYTVGELQPLPGAHLAANLALAREPYRVSGGAFDPTVGPLAEYYGFGAAAVDTSAVDEAEVARLRELVGFDHVATDTLAGGASLRVYPGRPGLRLDLSALAKGYAVDQVGLLLGERFGLSDTFVEIGGETRTRGRSPRGTPWAVGINTPEEGASLDDLALVLELGDAAVATSGNYRNVRLRGGRRYVHTIDPRTGRARPSSLLSATVVADDCATADAYATACMASGEAAGEVLAEAGLAGCLIFAGRAGRYDVRYVGAFAELVADDARE